MNENAKIRVLIAEDDPIQNDLLKDALELESDMACCGQACDGLEALAKLETEQPDVLLLDIVMPNMDGVDLLNELRENPPPKRPKAMSATAPVAHVWFWPSRSYCPGGIGAGSGLVSAEAVPVGVADAPYSYACRRDSLQKGVHTGAHCVQSGDRLGSADERRWVSVFGTGTADSTYAPGYLPDEQGRIRGNRGPERYYGAMR
jgi:CheY-like chemotaxis protein